MCREFDPAEMHLADASAKTVEQLRLLMRSKLLFEHPAFLRLLGMVPPDFVVKGCSDALNIGVHPVADYFAYESGAAFEIGIDRIRTWCSVPRSRYEARAFQLEEEPRLVPPHIRGPLFREDQAGMLRNIITGPMKPLCCVGVT